MVEIVSRSVSSGFRGAQICDDLLYPMRLLVRSHSVLFRWSRCTTACCVLVPSDSVSDPWSLVDLQICMACPNAARLTFIILLLLGWRMCLTKPEKEESAYPIIRTLLSMFDGQQVQACL